MKRTKEEAEQTRKELLNAALAIFSQKSYQATRLDEIAQKAGVTRGAIYHHFGSKEELYLALMDDASAVGNRTIQKAIEEGGTFIEIITRLIVYTLSLLEEDQHFRYVMALSLTPTDSEEFANRRYQDAVQLVNGISQAFQMGIAQGELRPDLDPFTAARALIGFQNGLAMLWLANPDAFSIKDNAQALAEIYVQGIAK